MILDSQEGTNAILIDFNESKFTSLVIHIPSNSNEIACRWYNGEGSEDKGQLILAVDSGQSSNDTWIQCGMAAKLIVVQVRKPDNGGFGAGFEAVWLRGTLTKDVCLREMTQRSI